MSRRESLKVRSDLRFQRRTLPGSTPGKVVPDPEAASPVVRVVCYDHTVQIMDLVETSRELCADLREYYRSAMNTQMNQVMTVLTIAATVFIPLSFVAGLYGMNFDPDASTWNMPELRWTYGYRFALAIMAMVVCGELLYFWRRGWFRF